MSPAPGRRRVKTMIAAMVTTLLAALCCGGGAVAYFLTDLGGSSDAFGFDCGKNTGTVDPDGDLPRVDSIGDEQVHNAAVIIQVGQRMGVPPRGWVVAIATAMQESWLRNLPNLGARNDHDSLGLFQQRPSTGWGSEAQIMQPAYAAEQFYKKLPDPGHGSVCRSPTPRAGRPDQRVPRRVRQARARGDPDRQRADQPGGQGHRHRDRPALRRGGALGEIAALGWTIPVKGPLWSGFRTASRPSHAGVDIGVPKGTEIHAAAAGIVVRVRCNAIGPNGQDWGCYRDGSPRVRGCGWYVDIMHAGGIMTRYCHQVTQPRVRVGQQVAAGQIIGLAGSTGNSSGPHLHFEVHTGGDSSSRGAVNPVPYMQQVGAPLGGGE
jgi:murein DD-endopeptidase MepM/ murein hydrolase activator NlpD